jgi:hypothetical protein
LGQFFAHFRLQPAFELERIGRGAQAFKSRREDETTVCGIYLDRKDDVEPTVRGITEREQEILERWQHQNHATENNNGNMDTEDWGNFWRVYTLSARGMHCRIVEVLRRGVM